MFLKDMNKTINHDYEEVIYNFGESEPEEEENTKDEASDPAEKNISSLKRRRSSKFWEYVEIDEPEDEFAKCPFKCQECSKLFKRLTSLRQHLSQDHNIANEPVEHEFASEKLK